jgi:hypothetical protein
MTDRELAHATVQANAIEQLARAQMGALDRLEREAAQAAMRQAVALRRALESWIVQRAMSAQQ